MPALLLRCLALAILLLPGPCGPLFSAAGQTTAAQPRPAPAYSAATVEQPPRPVGGGDVVAALEAVVQRRLVLPKDIGITEQSRIFVQFSVGPTGRLENLRMVHGILTDIDAELLAAIRQLPPFEPGRHRGRPVRVSYSEVPLRLLGPASPPQLVQPARGPALPDSVRRRLEARTIRERTARRRPAEAADEFLARVLPYSFSEDSQLVPYAWQPGPFGQQLFFDVPGRDGNEYGTDLFVLSPFRPDTYDVQVLPLPSLGDHTYLAALFFADADQDGQKELLALCESSLRDSFIASDGERLTGRATHYATYIFRYLGSDAAGRPRFEEDPTPRPYLDELATAAEVRAALVGHHKRPHAAK